MVVIGTTKYVEVLDTSLRCAGRFDHEISIGIPDETSRVKIFKVLTKYFLNFLIIILGDYIYTKMF